MSLKMCKVIVAKDGQYVEEVHYAHKLRELKNIEGFVATISTSNVKHPNPSVLRLALLAFDIDAVDFYKYCATLNDEDVAETATNDLGQLL